jgi:hypothetical protein
MKRALACMVTFIASLGAVQAKDASMPFLGHLYESPNRTEPIFVQTWPALIDDNNKATLEDLPATKLSFGKNAGISLFTARLPIPGGQAIISIAPRVGLHPLCDGLAVGPHDNYPHNMNCPARLTISRKGTYKTIDIGQVCTLYSEEPITEATSARAVYEPKTNSIRLYVMINGKHVERADGGDGADPMRTGAGPCDHLIAIPE